MAILIVHPPLELVHKLAHRIMHTPTSPLDVFSSSSPGAAPSQGVSLVDEEAYLRQETFGRLEDMSQVAFHDGYLLDWCEGDPDHPKPWAWYVD